MKFGYQPFRFCKLAGCIVVNYSENARIKVILEETHESNCI